MQWNMDHSRHNIGDVAAGYDALPKFDPRAAYAWKHLAQESKKHADYIKQYLNVTETDDPEPYDTSEDMIKDIRNNRNFIVSTANADHPIWTPEDNINFRIVHDVFGHAATGGDFGWHGENDACSTHFALSSPHAQKALATECLGQTGYAIDRGGFTDQRVGFIPGLHEGLAAANKDTPIPTQAQLMQRALYGPPKQSKWKLAENQDANRMYRQHTDGTPVAETTFESIQNKDTSEPYEDEYIIVNGKKWKKIRRKNNPQPDNYKDPIGGWGFYSKLIDQMENQPWVIVSVEKAKPIDVNNLVQYPIPRSYKIVDQLVPHFARYGVIPIARKFSNTVEGYPLDKLPEGGGFNRDVDYTYNHNIHFYDPETQQIVYGMDYSLNHPDAFKHHSTNEYGNPASDDADWLEEEYHEHKYPTYITSIHYNQPGNHEGAQDPRFHDGGRIYLSNLDEKGKPTTVLSDYQETVDNFNKRYPRLSLSVLRWMQQNLPKPIGADIINPKLKEKAQKQDFVTLSKWKKVSNFYSANPNMTYNDVVDSGHDYDPEWDYELEENQQKIQQIREIINQNLSNIQSYVKEKLKVPTFQIHFVKNLNGDVARYVDGTYSDPVILIDIDAHINNTESPQHLAYEIQTSIIHELAHAYEEMHELENDEDFAEGEGQSFHLGKWKKISIPPADLVKEFAQKYEQSQSPEEIHHKYPIRGHKWQLIPENFEKLYKHPDWPLKTKYTVNTLTRQDVGDPAGLRPIEHWEYTPMGEHHTPGEKKAGVNSGAIYINPFLSPEAANETLWHELQHAYQHQEKLWTPEMKEKYINPLNFDDSGMTDEEIKAKIEEYHSHPMELDANLFADFMRKYPLIEESEPYYSKLWVPKEHEKDPKPIVDEYYREKGSKRRLRLPSIKSKWIKKSTYLPGYHSVALQEDPETGKYRMYMGAGPQFSHYQSIPANSQLAEYRGIYDPTSGNLIHFTSPTEYQRIFDDPEYREKGWEYLINPEHFDATPEEHEKVWRDAAKEGIHIYETEQQGLNPEFRGVEHFPINSFYLMHRANEDSDKLSLGTTQDENYIPMIDKEKMEENAKRKHHVTFIPSLNNGKLSKWKLAGETKTKLLERASQLPEDTSEIVHEFDDGWTIRKVKKFKDLYREGTLMNNCVGLTDPGLCRGHNPWQYLYPDLKSLDPDLEKLFTLQEKQFIDSEMKKDPPLPEAVETWLSIHLQNKDPQRYNKIFNILINKHGEKESDHYYSLRDSDNIPHVTMGNGGGSKWEEKGRHNSEVKDKYFEYLNQWQKSLFPSRFSYKKWSIKKEAPARSKAQYRYMQGICNGSIEPPEGMTRAQACEYVKGQSPKDLPEKKSKLDIQQEMEKILIKKGFSEKGAIIMALDYMSKLSYWIDGYHAAVALRDPETEVWHMDVGFNDKLTHGGVTADYINDLGTRAMREAVVDKNSRTDYYNYHTARGLYNPTTKDFIHMSHPDFWDETDYNFKSLDQDERDRMEAFWKQLAQQNGIELDSIRVLNNQTGHIEDLSIADFEMPEEVNRAQRMYERNRPLTPWERERGGYDTKTGHVKNAHWIQGFQAAIINQKGELEVAPPDKEILDEEGNVIDVDDTPWYATHWDIGGYPQYRGLYNHDTGELIHMSSPEEHQSLSHLREYLESKDDAINPLEHETIWREAAKKSNIPVNDFKLLYEKEEDEYGDEAPYKRWSEPMNQKEDFNLVDPEEFMPKQSKWKKRGHWLKDYYAAVITPKGEMKVAKDWGQFHGDLLPDAATLAQRGFHRGLYNKETGQLLHMTTPEEWKKLEYSWGDYEGSVEERWPLGFEWFNDPKHFISPYKTEKEWLKASENSEIPVSEVKFFSGEPEVSPFAAFDVNNFNLHSPDDIAQIRMSKWKISKKDAWEAVLDGELGHDIITTGTWEEVKKQTIKWLKQLKDGYINKKNPHDNKKIDPEAKEQDGHALEDLKLYEEKKRWSFHFDHGKHPYDLIIQPVGYKESSNKISQNNIEFELEDNEEWGNIYALLNNNLIGNLAFEKDDEDNLINIKFVRVEKKYRNQGIGKALLEKLNEKYPYYEFQTSGVTPLGEKLVNSFERDFGKEIDWWENAPPEYSDEIPLKESKWKISMAVRGRPLSSDQINQLIEDYKAGMSLDEVSRKNNLNPITVRKYLILNNIDRMGPKSPRGKIRQKELEKRKREINRKKNYQRNKNVDIINDYIRGMGISELAFKYNVKYHTIRNILLRNNIPLNTTPRTPKIETPKNEFNTKNKTTNKILDLYYNKNKNIQEIANAFNQTLTQENIRNIIKQYGLKQSKWKKRSHWVEGFHAAGITPEGEMLVGPKWTTYHGELSPESGKEAFGWFNSETNWRGLYNPETNEVLHMSTPEEYGRFGYTETAANVDDFKHPHDFYRDAWQNAANKSGYPIESIHLFSDPEGKANPALPNDKEDFSLTRIGAWKIADKKKKNIHPKFQTSLKEHQRSVRKYGPLKTHKVRNFKKKSVLNEEQAKELFEYEPYMYHDVAAARGKTDIRDQIETVRSIMNNGILPKEETGVSEYDDWLTSRPHHVYIGRRGFYQRTMPPAIRINMSKIDPSTLKPDEDIYHAFGFSDKHKDEIDMHELKSAPFEEEHRNNPDYTLGKWMDDNAHLDTPKNVLASYGLNNSLAVLGGVPADALEINPEWVEKIKERHGIDITKML